MRAAPASPRHRRLHHIGDSGDGHFTDRVRHAPLAVPNLRLVGYAVRFIFFEERSLG